MNPGDRVAVIDADSPLYRIALSAEMCCKRQGMSGEDLWIQVRSLDDCYHEAETAIEAIVEKIGADDAFLCLSDARCFRYSIFPSYKSNRERTRRPPMMVQLRAALLQRKPWPTLAIKELEADDVAGITSTSLQVAAKVEPIIVSEDKDLLTIPGLIHRKGHTFEVSMEEANRAHLYQTLVGDYIDGYPGCPGIGAKRADRILDEYGADMWLGVVQAFEKAGLTYGEALVQAQVARILRASDWDAVKKEPILWTPRIAT